MYRWSRYVLAVATGLLMLAPEDAAAQIGEHRSDFSVGVNGGYVLSSVGFTPRVCVREILHHDLFRAR